MRKDGHSADDTLREEIQAFAKARLAPHKYPRQIAFVTDLPRTAPSKIRRHVLREREACRDHPL